MRDLLMAYLEVTQEIAKVDWVSEPEVLETLLDKRDKLIADLKAIPDFESVQNVEPDSETLIVLNEIKALEGALQKRFEDQLTNLATQIQDVKDEQVVHGKNKLAFQKYFSKSAIQPSVYFDQKK